MEVVETAEHVAHFDGSVDAGRLRGRLLAPAGWVSLECPAEGWVWLRKKRGKPKEFQEYGHPTLHAHTHEKPTRTHVLSVRMLALSYAHMHAYKRAHKQELCLGRVPWASTFRAV